MNISIDDYVELESAVHELIFYELHEHPLTYNNPKFKEYIGEDLCEMLHELQSILKLNENEFEILMHSFIDSFFETGMCPRRSDESICESINVETIQTQIQILRNIVQPQQRTDEWYIYRHNMITASNMWKVFGTECQYNSLIYEKCKPFEQHRKIWSASMNWGNIFEPVSIKIYEHKYKTHIEDFGCIHHPSIPCIGASPDGINVDPSSDRFGRMLEVKNIYNRDINGIPKEEYWIQMQIQLETCNLELCDFLETRFIEYASDEDFYNGTHEYKGVILYLKNDDEMEQNEIEYIYVPFELKKKEEIDEYISQQRTASKSLIRILYYYLDEMSCVVVRRNKNWFNSAKTKIVETWDTIVKERTEGYSHREPKKRVKSNIFVSQMDSSQIIHNLQIQDKIQIVKLE
jgi:putative phage-type endonuclease